MDDEPDDDEVLTVLKRAKAERKAELDEQSRPRQSLLKRLGSLWNRDVSRNVLGTVAAAAVLGLGALGWRYVEHQGETDSTRTAIVETIRHRVAKAKLPDFRDTQSATLDGKNIVDRHAEYEVTLLDSLLAELAPIVDRRTALLIDDFREDWRTRDGVSVEHHTRLLGICDSALGDNQADGGH